MKIVLTQAFVLLTMLAVPMLSQGQTQASVAAYDCAAQTQIPEAECNALKDLFSSTAGENWTDNANWGTGNPGDWARVALIGVAPNQNVVAISMDSNNLTGSLNSSLGNLAALREANFSHNNLTGPIPSSFSALINMRRLFLFNNQLTDGIPDIFTNWSNILLISIAENPNLGGSIPASLSANNSLQRIFLQNSGLTGGIPSALGDLPNLNLIDLSNNQIGGAIPMSFATVPATPANVDFSNNELDADGSGVALTPGALAVWAGAGVQRTLSSQSIPSNPPTPPAQISAVPASPLWSLFIMSIGLFFFRAMKRTKKPS